MQLERSRFEETVGAMSEQLMDFVEKMNKLERECVSKKSWNILISWQTLQKSNYISFDLQVVCQDNLLQRSYFKDEGKT